MASPQVHKPAQQRPPGGPIGPAGHVAKTATAKQIMAVMRLAGFPNNPNVLATGAAVVQCESANGANRGTIENGGCNTSGACGPWQIGVGGVGSGAAGDHGISVQCANDWFCATREAAKLYKADGWAPWVASQACWSLQVGAHLKDANVVSHSSGVDALKTIAGVLLVPGAGLTDLLKTAGVSVNNPLSGVDAIGAFFNLLSTPTFWLRLGKGLLGTVLLILGVVALMRALLGIDLPTYASALVKQRGIGYGVARTGGERRSEGSTGRLSVEEIAAREHAKVTARESAKNAARQSDRKAKADVEVDKALSFWDKLTPEEQAKADEG